MMMKTNYSVKVSGSAVCCSTFKLLAILLVILLAVANFMLKEMWWEIPNLPISHFWWSNGVVCFEMLRLTSFCTLFYVLFFLSVIFELKCYIHHAFMYYLSKVKP